MGEPTEDFPIVGSYNNQRNKDIDCERTVNMFQYNDPSSKKKQSLLYTSGLLDSRVVFPGASGGFRAEYVFKNVLYCVIGNTVYSWNGISVATLGVLISTDTGYVGIDANTFQVIFVDGVDGYIWDTNANTFTIITDAGFPVSPVDACNLDGFFVVANGGTNEFQLSSLNQGMVWSQNIQSFTTSTTFGENWLILGDTSNYQTGVPFTVSNIGGALPAPLVSNMTYFAIHIDTIHIRVATTYANAIARNAITLSNTGMGTQTITSIGQKQLGTISTHPGNIVACSVLHRYLFLFSDFYTEVWENQGIGTTLPFRRNNSLLMEFGTPSVGSISVAFDFMMFVSQDRGGIGSVMIVHGSQASPMSNRALEQQLAIYASAAQISDCRAFLIKDAGQIFYRMNFTAADHTFVQNVTQALTYPEDVNRFWHEEETLNFNRHPSQVQAYFMGRNYVGDYAKPILYLVDRNTYTNNGENIRRMRITKPIVPDGYQRIRIDRLQVDILQGAVAESIGDVLLYLLEESGQQILTELGIPLLLEQQDFDLGQKFQMNMFMSISKDGGDTYGYKVSAPLGWVGQRTARTLWRKLGVTKRGQPFVVRFEFFDAIPFIILGAAWAKEVLPE